MLFYIKHFIGAVVYIVFVDKQVLRSIADFLIRFSFIEKSHLR